MIRCRILAARVVGGDDDQVAEASGDGAHQRTLRAIAIAAAAEDGDDAPARSVPRRLEQIAERVVGVRVVDHHRDFVLRTGGQLKRVRARRRAPRRRVRSRRTADRARSRSPPRRGCCRRWGGRRASIARAAGRAASASSNVRPSSENDSGPAVMSAGLVDGVGHRPPAGVDAASAPRGSSTFNSAGALGRQHLEQAALRLKLSLHVCVEVEVIARQVGEHRRRRTSCRRRAAATSACDDTSIAHAPSPRSTISRSSVWTSGASGVVRAASRTSGRRCPRRYDRAENAAADVGRLEDRREQIRGRRLAVRAGDADDLHVAARIAVERRREHGERQPSRRPP